MDTLNVTEQENDQLLAAIEVLRKHGKREARLLISGQGEAWIIRQTARLVNGKQSG
jgi:hypothetical protein